MVREDPTRRFILDGTEIKALHGDTAKRLDQNGEAVSVTTYEDFSVTGVAFKEAAACYLAERVLKDFLKILLQEYPQDPKIQKALAIRLNKLNQPSIQQKMENARIETFFKNIGLVGHKNIFRAFYESRIPLIFFQSKQKNKKLVYPR